MIKARNLASTLLAVGAVGLTITVLASVRPADGQETGEEGGLIKPLPCLQLDDEYEDNDTPGNATRVKLPFSQDFLASCDGDDDWFAFSAPEGAEIMVRAEFEHENGDINLASLNEPSGATVGLSTTSTDDEEITVTATDSGLFRLRVHMFDPLGDDGNDYNLDIDIGCPDAGVFGSTFTDALIEPLPIVDNSTTGPVNCITIDEDGVIEQLMVGLEIDHPYVGDLSVTLEHVDTGTEASLIDRPGVPASSSGCSGDDIFATLSDAAALAAEHACAGSPPAISGTLRPNEPLGAFVGENIQGTWRLQVTDHDLFDFGELNAWSLVAGLQATPTPPATDPPPTSTSLPATATSEKPLGDVNDDGMVNAVDAALILQLSAGLVGSLPNEGSADVNEDGSINAVDAALILQHVAGLVPTLPP